MWVKKFNAGTTLLVVDSNILYTKNELEIINTFSRLTESETVAVEDHKLARRKNAESFRRFLLERRERR